MDKQYKIMIVEDHRDMLLVLKKYLEDQNFSVIEAESGELGIERFSESKPDLILMDIMLPGMSGLDAIQQIKNQQQNEIYVPIIIITAKSDISDIVKGLGTGADDYIIKPFHFDELIARVKTALRLKELSELLISQSKNLKGANKEISGLNKKLVEKNKILRKNIYGLHSLFEVSMDLSSILEMNKLVNSTLLTLMGQYSSKNALFMLSIKKNSAYLEVFDNKGFDTNTWIDFKLPKNDPLIQHFSINSQPITIEALKTKIRTSRYFDELEKNRLEMIAPVILNNVVEGLICIGQRIKETTYSDLEIQQITILSNIISITVNNAKLYLELEQLSYTDGMTELHNYRYFELRLKEEVVRQHRTNSGLSLLILDVDYFKNFNDTMGHQAGDDVLRKLGQILKETVRENDIVARYGGEEFAIILPTVERDGAITLAERIRSRVENTYFEGGNVQPDGKITVSIGEASLPTDADNYKDLIRKADIALYAAKRNGRNNVKTYTPDLIEET